MALRQHRETVVVPASRGTIVDRNGEPLAIGEARDDGLRESAAGRRRTRPDAGRREAARRRSGCPLPDARRPLARLRLRRAQGRSAQGEEAREARTSPGSASIPRSSATTRRARSRRRCSATRGSTTRASRGSSARSRGRSPASPGARRSSRTRSAARSTSSRRSRRRPGRSVRLTIDHQIQANAEEVLQETVRRWGARAATAVVMDPHTGAVLAMATAPRFNANRFPTTRADRRRNRAVTDTYEPGSTFKLVTVAAALQEGIVSPRTSFRLAPDDQGRRPRDPRGAHARDGAADRAGRSSSTRRTSGRSRSRERLGEGRLASWIDRFGFGSQDRHRLPGRVGRVRAPARPVVGLDDRHRPDRARHRRHAGADGTRVLGDRERRHARAAAPHRSHRRHERSRRRRGAGSSRARSPSRCSRCCAASSSRERAPRPRSPATPWPARREPRRRSIPTARYSTSRYVASFVGLVPATKPKLVIMVMVDEPHGDIYGGVVAAPAFREIARFNLQHLEIPQDAPSRSDRNPLARA